jgi:hypothetical protein
MPFNVGCEQVKPSLQLELIELQCSTQLNKQVLKTSNLEFYKTSPKSSYPNLICHAQRIMSMFASSYLCEKVFSSMKLRKSSVRNRLTDGNLASLLRVTASQLEPEYEKLLDTQSQFQLTHPPLYKGTKEVGNIKFVEIKEN